MAAVAEIAVPSRPSIGVGVVPLLALAIFIQYVDRGNLATAAPLIKDELKLSGAQIGVLLSAFYWTYTPSQILAGWLAERINAYRTLALGVLIWSLATVATGLASGFAALLVLRLLLGLGESAAFPCSSKLIGHHLPAHRLGAANGLIGVGLSLGPAVGTFAGGMMIAPLGWRPVFVIFGLASLLWFWPWLTSTRSAWKHREIPSDPAPAFLAIIARREAWGACLGHFASNYSFYFVVTWLPLYLVKARGFSIPQMAALGGATYLVYAVGCFVSGRLSDAWVRRGASPNRVRKTVAIASHVLFASSMVACAFGDLAVAAVGLFAAAVSFGLNTPTLFAIGQTLAGPRAAGKWISVQNCAGNSAGIVAPIVTGLVVDRTGQFFWAFLFAGAVALAGVVAWGLVVRRVAPLDWGRRDGFAPA